MKSVNKVLLKSKAAVLAASLREELCLFNGMPISIHSVLRLKHVQALFQPTSDSISGMAIRVTNNHGDNLSFMMVNTAKALGHQRFTACHELYHLLYQDNFSFVKEKTALFDEKNEQEYLADWFASYLMLPKEGLEMSVPLNEQQMNGITLGTLLQTEQRFRCSRAMLLYRLKDLKWIDENGYESFGRDVIRAAKSHGFHQFLLTHAIAIIQDKYLGVGSLKGAVYIDGFGVCGGRNGSERRRPTEKEQEGENSRDHFREAGA